MVVVVVAAMIISTTSVVIIITTIIVVGIIIRPSRVHEYSIVLHGHKGHGETHTTGSQGHKGVGTDLDWVGEGGRRKEGLF